MCLLIGMEIGALATETQSAKRSNQQQPVDDAARDQLVISAARKRAGWRLMGRALRPQSKSLVIATLVGLGWTATRVALPQFVGRAIDEGIVNQQRDSLIFWACVVAAAGAIQALLSGGRRYLAIRSATRLESDLRSSLLHKVVNLGWDFHDHTQTGQLIARAHTDVSQINFFLVFIPLAVANILTITVVAAVMFHTNATLAVVALAPLPFVTASAVRLSRKLHPEVAALQAELAGLATVVEESLSGIRAVKGFRAEQGRVGALAEKTERVQATQLKAARIRANYWPLLDFFPTLGLIGVLLVGGQAVIQDRISLGQLVVFNQYVFMLIWPLRVMGMLVAQSQRAVVSASRVDEVLAIEPTMKEAEVVKPIATTALSVRFDQVTFAYQAGPTVFDGLSFEVQPGEIVAIVGGVASGKSTLARLLMRFYDCSGGSVQVGGVDVRDAKLSDLRTRVALVMEDTFLFSGSLRSNIAMARPNAVDAEILEALRAAGALEMLEALPVGLATLVGEHGYSLSGGQRQRVSIARALITDPGLLILDDATSAVDPSKEEEISQGLKTALYGRTTLVISHRLATIALADRVLFLENGQLAASGTHAELLTECPNYAVVLAQASRPEGADVR